MIEKQPKESKEELIEGVYGRLIKFSKRRLAKILLAGSLFLSGIFPPQSRAEDFARELENSKPKIEEIIKLEKQQPEQLFAETISEASYVQANRESFLTRKDAFELTRNFNDLKTIKEFLQPESPIGVSDIWAYSINVPSRLDLGPLVKQKTREIFVEGAKMKWWPGDVETLRRTLKGTRYEIKRVNVEVRIHEERNVLVEFLRDILLRELEKRGARRDVIDRILERLSLRTSIVAAISIEIVNLETKDSLTLMGFGVPERIGVFISPLGRDLAIREAIVNGFDNLMSLLKKALGRESYQERAFIIMSG